MAETGSQAVALRAGRGHMVVDVVTPEGEYSAVAELQSDSVELVKIAADGVRAVFSLCSSMEAEASRSGCGGQGGSASVLGTACCAVKTFRSSVLRHVRSGERCDCFKGRKCLRCEELSCYAKPDALFSPSCR